MHVTLASDNSDPDFAPETMSEEYQRSLHEEMCTHAQSVFQLLRTNVHRLPAAEIAQARALAAREQELLELYSQLRGRFDARRIRIHGDYHLGQVLFTGSDFVIIDFEGEPLRTLAHRRTKRSPLQDVAGMLRSFDYAAHTGMTAAVAQGADQKLMTHFAHCWREWVSASFLRAYLETCGRAVFIPAERRETAVLLDTLLLDKAVYELGYEINNRPDWVGIPIAGIARILDERASATREEHVA
jgi:maltose alpha-D-glucosyltransferase/alpha-amylase